MFKPSTFRKMLEAYEKNQNPELILDESALEAVNTFDPNARAPIEFGKLSRGTAEAIKRGLHDVVFRLHNSASANDEAYGQAVAFGTATGFKWLANNQSSDKITELVQFAEGTQEEIPTLLDILSDSITDIAAELIRRRETDKAVLLGMAVRGNKELSENFWLGVYEGMAGILLEGKVEDLIPVTKKINRMKQERFDEALQDFSAAGSKDEEFQQLGTCLATLALIRNEQFRDIVDVFKRPGEKANVLAGIIEGIKEGAATQIKEGALGGYSSLATAIQDIPELREAFESTLKDAIPVICGADDADHHEPFLELADVAQALKNTSSMWLQLLKEGVEQFEARRVRLPKSAGWSPKGPAKA